MRGAQEDPSIEKNSHPQDGSSKICRNGLRTKERPRDELEKTAMCLVGMAGKRSKPMSSTEQVAQGFKNSAKIVIVSVEKDKYTIVDNEVQFQIPLAGVGFLTNPTDEVLSVIGLTKTALHPTTYLVDSREGLNIINEYYSKLKIEMSH